MGSAERPEGTFPVRLLARIPSVVELIEVERKMFAADMVEGADDAAF